MSRFLKAFWSSFAASSSSAGMSDGSISMIVTSVPKRLKIDANSQPMIPPPRMTSRRGTCRLREEPGRVDAARRVDPGDRRPHGVRAGRDDRLLEGDVLRSSTAIVFGPVNRPRPLTHCAVRLEERGHAAGHLVDHGPLPSGDRAQSSVGSPTTTPSFANVSFASWKACALCTQAFVGMQPTRGRCRRGRPPRRCMRPARRAGRRGWRPCIRPGRLRGRRRRRSFGIGPFVRR